MLTRTRARRGAVAVWPTLRCAVTLALVVALTGSAVRVRAAEPTVSLSTTIGDEIDRAERDRYHLFPDVNGFVSARIVKLDKGYRVDFTYRDDDAVLREGSRRIDDETFDNTRLHVALIETARGAGPRDVTHDAQVLYGAALLLAADARYSLCDSLLAELRYNYPAQYDSLDAASTHDPVVRLQGARTGLFRTGTTIDQSGRTDVLVFSGFYGVWVAIGTPIALDVDSSEGFAAFLVTVPAASVLLAHAVTKHRSVTDADAEIVSLGGWFGAWQGVGWTAFADAESDDVVGVGVLGGLAGIGLACALNKTTELSAGHAALMNSANWWGAWLGLLVGAAGADDSNDDDQVLASALIGSSAAVVLTGVAASNTTLTQRRVRYMNLGGFLGAIFGAGLAILTGVDDDAALSVMLGVSSVLGGYVGVEASHPSGTEQSRSRAATGASLASDNARSIQPFAGWSAKDSEARLGFEMRF